MRKNNLVLMIKNTIKSGIIVITLSLHWYLLVELFLTIL